MKDKNPLRLLFWFVFGVALVALMCGLCSCKTQRQIQTEYVYVDRTDTVNQIKWLIDSINIHDSIVTLFNGLKDNYKATITIKSTSYNALSSDQIAIATAKGWSVAKV